MFSYTQTECRRNGLKHLLWCTLDNICLVDWTCCIQVFWLPPAYCKRWELQSEQGKLFLALVPTLIAEITWLISPKSSMRTIPFFWRECFRYSQNEAYISWFPKICSSPTSAGAIWEGEINQAPRVETVLKRQWWGIGSAKFMRNSYKHERFLP